MVFIWIFLYGAMHMVLQRLGPAWAPGAAAAVYAAALCLWIFRTGRSQRIRLNAPRAFSPKMHLRGIPLLCAPLCNLLLGQGFSLHWPTILLTVGACLTEEIFFRGFLLHFLLPRGKKAACILCAILFSLYHCTDISAFVHPGFLLAQAVFAFSAGFCLCALTLKHESILPGTILHLLINLTAGTGLQSAWAYVLCAAVYLVCGRHVIRKI